MKRLIKQIGMIAIAMAFTWVWASVTGEKDGTRLQIVFVTMLVMMILTETVK